MFVADAGDPLLPLGVYQVAMIGRFSRSVAIDVWLMMLDPWASALTTWATWLAAGLELLLAAD